MLQCGHSVSTKNIVARKYTEMHGNTRKCTEIHGKCRGVAPLATRCATVDAEQIHRCYMGRNTLMARIKYAMYTTPYWFSEFR